MSIIPSAAPNDTNADRLSAQRETEARDRAAHLDRAAMAMKIGPDWQAGRHEPRDPEAEITTPSLDEMAEAPGATQTKYRVTYARVGRHGGRNGSPAPAPLTVWAVTADGLAEHIAKDVRPYILSNGAEVVVDLEAMAGSIFAGFRTAGTFTLEALQVAEGGAA
ncbi:hypothetical protein [Streptomyces sp. PA03-2a]|uniref:hypothetical protein n=1 Tax=Streptomyces sp. PA03-2a TaxID=3028701 RepID=UPI0029B30082|nr:hypothetical protein [Streptomyces sp. PA03-2a]MDX2732821.1 hypothetical protein [Streptomyces sp. PA03-2a]